MTMEFTCYTLPNGIRCIHKQVRSAVVNCALTVNTGSRDEEMSEQGLAHLLEHAFFKGTTHRKAFHINCRLENLGGELNAYTTKEETVDEINSYKDSPSDRIFDDFEDMIFVGSSLGHNILGCKSALMKYTRDDLLRFVARTYNTDQMVFSVIGNVSAKRFKDTCDRYFGGMGESLRGFTRDAVVPVASFSKELHRKCYQAHCILGGRAYNLNDERRVVLSLLTNLLGGPSANSLLNLAVRERNGLAYNIEAGFTPFSDTGLATIYFGTDKERADECLELIDLELTKIRSGKLSDRLLHIAKKQYLGQITIAMENNESYMLSAARSFLVYNNIDAMETIREKIGTVTRDEIVAVANEIYGTQNLSMLMYR